MPDKVLLLVSSPARIKAREGIIEILYGGNPIGTIIVTDSGVQIRFSTNPGNEEVKEALEIDESSITIDFKSLLQLSN